MAIIISQNGKNAVRVEKSSFEKEDYLQQYIYQNPESIPLYDIKEDIRLLILSREFQTESGPIDALGVDKDGEIYIVETKLFRNPDKRTVVAQALDYGASLWKHSGDFAQFTARLDVATHDVFNKSVSEKLSEFFSLSKEETDILLENVRRNLSEGAFRFVVLMDRLDSRLKDLIVYLNQNSQFDIYAVEIEYYKHGTQEIIIPKIFGAEVKKDVGIARKSTSRTLWTETALLYDAKQKMTDEEYTAFEKIYRFCKNNGAQINLGTGSYGSFSPIFPMLSAKSLFTMSTDKRLSFNFEWLARDNEQIAERFKRELEGIGFSFPENYKEIRPSVLSDEWLPRTEDFLKILSGLRQ